MTPDHVSMVWCKQLVMVVNRFLFGIVDPVNEQVSENSLVIRRKAEQYFQVCSLENTLNYFNGDGKYKPIYL